MALNALPNWVRMFVERNREEEEEEEGSYLHKL